MWKHFNVTLRSLAGSVDRPYELIIRSVRPQQKGLITAAFKKTGHPNRSAKIQRPLSELLPAGQWHDLGITNQHLTNRRTQLLCHWWCLETLAPLAKKKKKNVAMSRN